MTRTFLAMPLLWTLAAAPVLALPADELSALNRLPGADIPITLNFERVQLSIVVSAIASAAAFKVKFEGGLGDQPVTVKATKQNLKQVLIDLASRYDLAYEVTGERQLVVSKRSKG